MPGAPSEPERYSIDEMMDRLKNAPAENPQDGELITRADGTQVVRTRKRKRRSSQSQKETVQKTQRAKILQVSAVLVLLLATGLAIGAAILYVNSSPFRDKLIRDIQQDSGATAELIQFRMNPKTANAAQLSLTWPEGSFLQSLQLSNLNAEVFPTSFIGKPMNGEEISAINGVLNLHFPKVGSEVNPLPPSSTIHFKRYRTQRLDVTLGDPLNPMISLVKSEGSLTAQSVGGHPQLALYQGNVAIAGCPKLRLDRALVEFGREEINFINLRLLHEKKDGGSLAFSGKIAPYRTQQPASLAVRLESFDLSGLIGPELGQLISATIDSVPAENSNYLSFMPTGDSPAKLDISFCAAPLSPVEIHRFPFLVVLARLLDNPWFEHPTFESKSSGTLHRESGTVSLRDLNLESRPSILVSSRSSVRWKMDSAGSLCR
jgi:hypothetical protein